MWKCIDTGLGSAERNMQLDAEFLEDLDPEGSPLLHFYDWESESGTYGYFLKPEKYLDLKGAQKWGIDLARRPTGGGIVFHVSDLAFSALVPASYPTFSHNPLHNYNFINNLVLRAVKNYFNHTSDLNLLPVEPAPLDASSRHFCMAKPTQYDVMLDGRKIAGSAQRKRKQGYLHQGTIAIALPKKEFLHDILIPGTKVFEAMEQNTFSILGSEWTDDQLQEVRDALKLELKKTFEALE